MPPILFSAMRPWLLDGAMGTELMRRGLGPGECPEEWNLSHQGVVEEIHRDYFAAGSHIVNTNSFGASGLRLDAFGLEGSAGRINFAAARIAVTLRDREYPSRLIAGNMGPCGKLRAPLGDAQPAAIHAAFVEQARALVRGGVDVINIETMFDLDEAALAVAAAREVSRSIPVLVSMAFREGPRGYRTMMGVDPQTAVSTLREAGATLVGCNCEVTASDYRGLVPLLAALNGGATCAQPNAGQPRVDGDLVAYDETPEHFAAAALELVRLGAQIIGGCCGTTPAHSAALSEVTRDMVSPAADMSGACLV